MSWESFDFTHFWSRLAEPATDEQIAATEEKLGRKLPQSYVELLKMQNGGITVNRAVWTESALYPLDIVSIHGAGDGVDSLLEGQRRAEEEGYPPVGPTICDCTSGDGWGMIFLDYTQLGRTGEPAVIAVAKCDYSRKKIADSFEEFIRGLKGVDATLERWSQAVNEEYAARQKKKSIWQKIHEFFVGSDD